VNPIFPLAECQQRQDRTATTEFICVNPAGDHCGDILSQYAPDHCRVLDTGNDPDVTTALIASFDINIKYTLQSLCPVQRSPFFGRGLVGTIN
jgi:hypothetical protein